MTPLSIVFRVDAEDDEDARRQLADVIATAGRLSAALRTNPSDGLMQETERPWRTLAGPARRSPITGRMVDVNRDGTNTAQTDPKRHAPRPWDDDPRGMGA